MARYLDGIPEAGYMAVVSVRWRYIGVAGDENGFMRRCGIYNTPEVATARAKKMADEHASYYRQVTWWIEKAETSWTRVDQ